MGTGKKAASNARRNAKPRLRGHIWVEGSDGVFIGWGRVALLESIRERGSITKAAKSLNMAYRHAWDLVDSMNRQTKKPFVEVAAGGKGGGGATVTEEGDKAIKLFRTFADDFEAFMERERKKLGLVEKKGR